MTGHATKWHCIRCRKMYRTSIYKYCKVTLTWHWHGSNWLNVHCQIALWLGSIWWSVKPVSMGHIPRAEWFALTANRMWRCSMMPATSAMHIWCNICFIRKATLMWTWSHFGMFQQIRHKEPNPKLGRRGHLQSFALGKVMFTKPCSLFLFFLNLKIARKMPRKWKTKKQISKIKKTQKQNKREKKGKTKSKKKRKTWTCPFAFFLHLCCFFDLLFFALIAFCLLFFQAKSPKKSKKSKKSKTKATNKHIEKAKINNKNANGQVHFFLFFFFPFLPFHFFPFILLPVFFGFEVLLFDFPCDFLFFLLFFSSLKHIRISYRGGHKGKVQAKSERHEARRAIHVGKYTHTHDHTITHLNTHKHRDRYTIQLSKEV